MKDRERRGDGPQNSSTPLAAFALWLSTLRCIFLSFHSQPVHLDFHMWGEKNIPWEAWSHLRFHCAPLDVCLSSSSSPLCLLCSFWFFSTSLVLSTQAPLLSPHFLPWYSLAPSLILFLILPPNNCLYLIFPPCFSPLSALAVCALRGAPLTIPCSLLLSLPLFFLLLHLSSHFDPKSLISYPLCAVVVPPLLSLCLFPLWFFALLCTLSAPFISPWPWTRSTVRWHSTPPLVSL